MTAWDCLQVGALLDILVFMWLSRWKASTGTKLPAERTRCNFIYCLNGGTKNVKKRKK
jgi:hypothetical protein